MNLNLLAGSGSSTERTQTSSSNLEPNLPKAKMKGSPNNILYIYLKYLKYKKEWPEKERIGGGKKYENSAGSKNLIKIKNKRP